MAACWRTAQPLTRFVGMKSHDVREIDVRLAWDALSTNEQSNTARVTQLVQMTEEVIGGEQRALLATSQAAKQMAKAANAASGGAEGDESRER